MVYDVYKNGELVLDKVVLRVAADYMGIAKTSIGRLATPNHTYKGIYTVKKFEVPKKSAERIPVVDKALCEEWDAVTEPFRRLSSRRLQREVCQGRR